VQILEKAWDRELLLSVTAKVFSRVIKLPTQNVFNGISDKVTCHCYMQIFLKTPGDRRKKYVVAGTPQVFFRHQNPPL
jgi:hypothetical protein